MMRLLISMTLVLAMGALNAMAQKYEPKWAGEVAVLQVIDGDTIAVPAEKSNVKLRTSASAGLILFDIGNVREKMIIKGGRSTTQIKLGYPIMLIVRCKDNLNDPASFIQVLEFEEKKKERRIELAKLNWLGTLTQNDLDHVPYKADKYGESSYILTLEPQFGEYGVRVLNPDNVDEKMTIFNCFGVH
ncbi:MAG: hypothetical protein NC043_08115 [Muribaculaceae bacterium]|nr:hypothetical protein [Muribaculaceae bacterium]